MPFPVTKGYGSQGDGSGSGLASTSGFGDPAGTGAGFTILLIEAYPDRLELVFSTNVALFGPALVPAQWTVTTGVSGAPVPVVTSVVVAGPRVKLYHTEARTGVLYTLALPVVGIQNLFSDPYGGPFTSNFTGVGIVPFVVVAGAGDGFSVKVIFSEPVEPSDALIPSNYVITGSGGLTVFEVTQENATIFNLRTSLQQVGAAYTLTVSNVRDLQGNLV